MKIKTQDLTGPALDLAVAEANGTPIYRSAKTLSRMDVDGVVYWQPSIDWAQGGPIIERECMDILCLAGGDDGWQADKYLHTEKVEGFGPTPLIAAMRCFVASRLGDEVEVPDELVGTAHDVT